jgi:hypothetical protein
MAPGIVDYFKLVGDVSPLRGSVLLADTLFPPLPRWATFFRP